jgi:dihydroneopterin aldolase
VEVRPGGRGDDVDRIVSYDYLTDAVAEALAAERLSLLETLAERIAARVLAPVASVSARVTVEKLDLAPGALGVEIVRRRDEVHPAAGPAVRPAVYFLGNAAVGAPRLAAWLDGLATGAILCVGAPDVAVPRAAAPAAQRRIDLMAIGQNAWILAGRDPRCLVRETRTELEWAAARGELSVWAPAKLALDLAGAPSAEGPALAAWLARVVDAARLVFVDAEPPAGAVAERGTVG